MGARECRGCEMGFGRGRLFGLVVGVACLAGLGGCGFEDELVAVHDRAREAEAAILADREELIGLAESLPAEDAARGAIERVAAAREDQAAVFGSAAEKIGALLASAESGDGAGTIETGAGLVLPLLPAGWQVPALLAAGLAASVWRAARLKQGAVSIARGLEKAMRDDDQLREGVRRQAATLRTVQTPTARRIVDEATRPGWMMRLPV